MRADASQDDSRGWQGHSANDLLKSRWNAWLAWSTMAAVALHGAAFVLFPSWYAVALDEDEGFGRQPLQWISLSLPSSGIPGDLGASLVETEEEEGGPEPGEGTEISAWEAAGLSDAVRELLRGPMPAPTIAEPEPEDGRALREDGNTTRIGGSAVAAELEELPAADSLDLAFLASLRPELALLDPTSWVLVRNPNEVGAFMRRSGNRMQERDAAAASVAIWIDERGSVEWAEINQSSGRTDLDELALQLFSEVVAFHPARDQGVRVPISAIFWVNFPW